jgi:dephospho-CoA kinase
LSKPVIGIIGGIGSGKSTVASDFARHGAAIVSGDQLGHEALRQPEIKAKVIERFGAGIANNDGEIDRRKLGTLVFADSRQLRALEAIVFPWIKGGLHQQIAAAQGNPAFRLIVVDAAVMVEAGWDKFCDKIVFVDAPREQRLARLAKHRGWTEKEVEARAMAQMSLTDKAARADAIIDNSGPAAALGSQIAYLLKQWGFPVAIDRALLDNIQK